MNGVKSNGLAFEATLVLDAFFGAASCSSAADVAGWVDFQGLTDDKRCPPNSLVGFLGRFEKPP